jgi:hypothetical protein
MYQYIISIKILSVTEYGGSGIHQHLPAGFATPPDRLPDSLEAGVYPGHGYIPYV